MMKGQTWDSLILAPERNLDSMLSLPPHSALCVESSLVRSRSNPRTMPVIQSSHPQYKFNYTVAGTDSVRRNSLKGNGPISVEAAHMFHTKIPTDAVLPANGGGTYNFTQHMLKHVMLDSCSSGSTT